MTTRDLANYKAVIRQPVQGEYRGYQIASMPPPSSGGIHIIEILNIMEGYPVKGLGHNTAETIHLMAEAMKRAYADRSKYLGDPDFITVPVKGLTDKEYANNLRSKGLVPGPPAVFHRCPEHAARPGRCGACVLGLTRLFRRPLRRRGDRARKSAYHPGPRGRGGG